MKNIDGVNKYKSDTILNSIFNAREEQLYTKISKNIKIKNKKITYDKISDKIDEVLPNDKDFKEYLEEYLNQENLISADENEMFYKYGFCEGVKMLLEILSKNNNTDM